MTQKLLKEVDIWRQDGDTGSWMIQRTVSAVATCQPRLLRERCVEFKDTAMLTSLQYRSVARQRSILMKVK